MLPRFERRTKRLLAPSRASLPSIALGSFALAAVTFSGLAPARADAPKGSISSLQTVHTGKLVSYDITVTSSTEFPMRDELVTLAIGGQEFSNSHYIPGTTLNTLVFSLTQKQFQSLQTGATAIVYYGHDDASITLAQWALGTLDKSMLDRVPVGSPIIDSPILVSPVKIAPVLASPVKASPVLASPSPAKTIVVSASKLRAASRQKGKK